MSPLTQSSGEDRGEAKDAHLCAYLRIYHEYLGRLVELQSVMRDGHLNLAKSRRDLSRTRNTVGALQFPARIEPLARVESDAGASGRLTLAVSPPGKPAGRGADPPPEATPTSSGAETPIGVMCGDRLALEPGTVSGAGATSLQLRSDISLAPSLGSLKQAQFQGLLSEAGADALPRLKPQQPPDPAGDPLRWFSALPPPALRTAQRSFRRSAELAVDLCNLRAQLLDAHRLCAADAPPPPE